MKTYAILAVSALALGVAGCGGSPKTRTALNCPQTQGDLSRTSVAPDGKTCTYQSSEGAEVTLQLVSVQGGPDATLKSVEDNLMAAAAPPSAPGAPSADAKAEAKAEGKAPAKADAGSARDASAAASEAEADARSSSVTIDSDGSHKGKVRVAGGAVIVDDDKGETHVNLPGIHVDANDNNDTANVQVGPIHIQAGDHGATIHMRRDVRLRGESLSPEKRGLRATFISEGKDRTDGYHFVGYEAGGPKAGPLTVAVVRSKVEIDQGGKVYSAVKRLVRDNGGV
jgi:hypothetical protein